MAATPGPSADGIARVTREELLALRRQMPRSLAPPLDRLHTHRAGTQSAVMRGRGMDYRESRAYQPGDDVRRLDWRLTARSGRLHTKLFQEERERNLLIVLDTHASMQFGTRRRFKSVQAARAAAIAAWLGVATGMRVGLQLFGSRTRLLRPAAGTRAVLSIIHALADAEAPEASEEDRPLSDALRRIARLARGGSQVLLISDGGCLDAKARESLVALRRQSHVRVLVVADALESALPPAGRYPLAWQEQVRAVDLETRAARVRFRESLGRGAKQLQQLSAELGLRCQRIDTEVEPLRNVADLLGIAMGARR